MLKKIKKYQSVFAGAGRDAVSPCLRVDGGAQHRSENIAVRLRVKKYVQNLHDSCYKKAIKTIAAQGDFEHGPP
jgi:hypothetical protein